MSNKVEQPKGHFLDVKGAKLAQQWVNYWEYKIVEHYTAARNWEARAERAGDATSRQFAIDKANAFQQDAYKKRELINDFKKRFKLQ